MPDVEYKIVYSLDSRKFEAGVDRLSAKLKELDSQVEKTKKNLRTLGSDTAGLTKMMSGLKALDRELQSKVADATKAEKALSGVGKGNRSVAELTARLKDLEKQLAAVTAAAAAATSAGAGVGKGGPPASGGSGGSPAGGSRGGRTGIGGVAAYAAFSGLRKVASAAGDSIGARREFFSGAADLASTFRQDLQGLAVLKDKTYADDALLREQVGFQKQTGFNAEEASQFRTEFGGAVQPGIKTGNISQQTADRLEVEAARFTKRYDLGAFSGGRMAGLMGQYGKVPSVEAGMGQMAQAAEYTNVYGLGTPKQMMAPMIGLAADMLDSEEGGRFSSLEDMAATFAATTFKAKSPAAAGTQIRQANRLLRKFDGEGTAAFLGKQGITPADDYQSALRKIAPAISGPDGDLVLANAGFKNSTERDSVRKQVDLLKLIEEAKKDPRIAAAGRNAIPANDAFSRTLPFQQSLAENEEFGSMVELGIQGERMKAMRAAARARMADPNQPGGQTLKAGLGQSVLDMSNSAYTLGGVSGEDLRVDREAFAGLVRGGSAVGVDVRKMAPNAAYNADKGLPMDSEASRREIIGATEAVVAKGGNPFGTAAGKLRDAAAAVEKLGGQGPDRRPPGDGGAGVVPGRR